ncbi:hypothetical protein AB1Y20_002455 [Prymnesium parvum]|uniref:Dolichol kinase n=1 Tax=Prymnesium parvum TaxID=97485 RepID=A0AB34J9A1_PRYPA
MRLSIASGKGVATHQKGEQLQLEDTSDDESLGSPPISRTNSVFSAHSQQWLDRMRAWNSVRLPGHVVSLSAYWLWQKPRLRVDWQHLEAERSHDAHVTTEEVLWVVIITMGVAAMRTRILDDEDVQWYILHFFCFVRVVSSSIKYAARFNDHDLAHQTLWGFFSLGLLLQIAYVDHSMTGFAAATCALYGTIAAAHLRVACLLPRAAYFCLFAMAENLIAASIFVAIILDLRQINERALLVLHIFLEPLFALLFKVLTGHVERSQLSAATSRRLTFSFDARGSASRTSFCRSPSSPRGVASTIAEAGSIGEAAASPPAARHSTRGSCSIPPSMTEALIAGATSSWDIPHDAEYTLRRCQGYVQMIIVCSFLFPIGLQGKRFVASGAAAACALLGNGFALLLKLSLLDAERAVDGSQGRRHALRRSRAHALGFLTILPLTMASIALTGVGFLAAIRGNAEPFPRQLICGGAATTSILYAMSVSLHAPPTDTSAAVDRTVAAFYLARRRQVVLLALCSGLFMLAQWLPLGTVSVCACVVIVQMGSLIGLVLISAASHPASLDPWRWRRPRQLVDLMDATGHLLGAREHFFTVLLAVAVFSINERLRATEDLQIYCLLYLAFYASLSSSLRYAARFNDDDGAHKVLWSVYSFLLLLVLQGMATVPLRAGVTLFKVAVASTFLFTALCFSGRAACRVPSAVAAYFAGIDLLLALIFALSCFADEAGTRWLLWGFGAVALMCDPIRELYGELFAVDEKRRKMLPKSSLMYIVARFNDLLIEVLGVAVIVPNAFFPGAFPHATLVLLGDVLAAVMAVSLKICIFDVEPLSVERHALYRSRWSGCAFLFLHPLTNLAVCAIGGSMAMLIPAVGYFGHLARSPFAQRVLCFGSATQLFCTSLGKLLHTPKRKEVHYLKAATSAAGGAASLLPLLHSSLGDFFTLCFVCAVLMLVNIVHLALTRMNPPDKRIERGHSLMTSTPLL